MSTLDKCPHCGSPVQSTRDGFKSFTCGAYVGKVAATQPTLCYERAAHAETKIERDWAKEYSDRLEKQRDQLQSELAATKRELGEAKRKEQVLVECAQEIQSKLEKAEARVAELEAAIELARVGH